MDKINNFDLHNNYPIRVSIRESEYFDEYILDTFCNISLNTDDSYLLSIAEKIKKVIKICYFSYYIYNSLPTPGQSMLNVIYDFDKFSVKIKTIYIFFKHILPIFTKLILVNTQSSLFAKIIEYCEKFYNLIDLFFYVKFLFDGKQLNVAQWLLGLSFRKIYKDINLRNSNYIMKQVLYSKLIDLVIFIFRFKIGKDKLFSFLHSLDKINNDDINNNKSINTNVVCYICNNKCTITLKLNCKHTFCYCCLTSYMKTNSNCPK